MKLLLRRAAVLLVLIVSLVFGMSIFLTKYFTKAPQWANYPANKHLYANGKSISSGIIYDRHDNVLYKMTDGSVEFHRNKTVRTALMHATGDLKDNVSTGAALAFSDKLSGWDFANGSYSFDGKRGGATVEGGGGIKAISDGKTNDAGRTIMGRGSIALTLDADLCATAYKALNGRKGTVGVYNYKTGKILCMVSAPSFDPQNPPKLEGNPQRYEGAYINRFLSSVYTPGSVFKLVTAAAAIDHIDGIENKTYQCDGKLNMDGVLVTCPSAHGEVTLEKALADSCNTTFGEIACELGGEILQEYADMAGFNSALEINGIKTATGSVDVTDAQGGDLAWAGIGQYTNTANPLNFMTYMGAIANDGVRVTPEILDSRGAFSKLFGPKPERKRILSSATAEKLGTMMRNNVVSAYGEGNFKGLEMCAKSGTAEVGDGIRPHSWFAGYLDRDEFPLAFVVVIENGGAGSKVAGSVAAKVLQAAVDDPSNK
jgi:peptidoglycan glycosyltransferase